MNSFCLFGVCVLGLILITPVYNAPKHRYKDHSSAKYDQKQTGDYNVQLHLKDFHIFALMGDDAWGGFGDYDYNYDYSDLTIKPSLSPVTSENPPEAISASEASSVEITTQKQIQSSANTESSSPTTQSSSTTTLKPSSEPEKVSSTETPSLSSTPKVEKTTKLENVPVTSISLIPVKIIQDSYNDHPLPLGEILHYRKCADGYSKDVQGRCRKITRKNSHLPFDFTRLASKLASKIRRVAVSRESSQ